MHHAISCQLAQARIADLRHHAQRDILARAARRARPGWRGHAVPRRPVGWRLAEPPRAGSVAVHPVRADESP